MCQVGGRCGRVSGGVGAPLRVRRPVQLLPWRISGGRPCGTRVASLERILGMLPRDVIELILDFESTPTKVVAGRWAASGGLEILQVVPSRPGFVK